MLLVFTTHGMLSGFDSLTRSRDRTDSDCLTNVDRVFKQDRFFCYPDADILPDVRPAAKQGSFAPEANPGAFHSDATESYKQT